MCYKDTFMGKIRSLSLMAMHLSIVRRLCLVVTLLVSRYARSLIDVHGGRLCVSTFLVLVVHACMWTSRHVCLANSKNKNMIDLEWNVWVFQIFLYSHLHTWTLKVIICVQLFQVVYSECEFRFMIRPRVNLKWTAWKMLMNPGDHCFWEFMDSNENARKV